MVGALVLGTGLVAGGVAAAVPAPPAAISALDVPPGSGTGVTYASDPEAVSTASAPLAGFPRQGADYLLMSTGRSADVFSAEEDFPSTDLDNAPPGADGNDSTRVDVALVPPAGASCVAFDFSFLSEEYPEYVGTQFNDVFTAELNESNITVAPTATTNGVGRPLPAREGGATTSAVPSEVTAPNNFAFDAQGNVVSINTVSGLAPAPGTTMDGATPPLTATSPIEKRPDGSMTLILTVQDLGDSVLDSAVVVDNLRWLTGNCSEGASLSQTFTGLTPSRLQDTRPTGTTPDGLFQKTGAFGPNTTRDLQVGGRGGVPADAVAVVLNVTVTEPTAASYLTAYPTGATRPNASNLNFQPGQTIPNAVVVKLGTGGRVSLYNYVGSTQVIVDVAGYFGAGSAYVGVSPARVLETRVGAGLTTVDGESQGGGAIGPGQTREVRIAGRGGVPANASSVVLNVTATGASADSYLTAFPAGSPRPNASNLNFVAGQTIPNSVIVKLGTDGKVSLYNYTGTTQVVADVSGYLPAGPSYTGLTPARLLDTRPGGATADGQAAGGGALGPNQTRLLKVTGRGGVPTTGVSAVVLNVTAVSPTAAGYLTVFPTGTTTPAASNLNFVPGQTIPNLVVVKVGDGGQVSLYNYTGSTQVVADVMGWFPL